VKYTKSGSITISALRDESNKEVVLSVSDTGMGIKEEEHKKLSEDLSQILESSICNTNGVGLSICKILAKNLNLKIYSDSNYGYGSKFSIAIPYSAYSDCSNKYLFSQVNPSHKVNLIIN
jgi:signal transduction histidine kinase